MNLNAESQYVRGQVCTDDALVVDGAKQLETGRNLLLGPVGLNDSAHDGNVVVLRADVVR